MQNEEGYAHSSHAEMDKPLGQLANDPVLDEEFGELPSKAGSYLTDGISHLVCRIRAVAALQALYHYHRKAEQDSQFPAGCVVDFKCICKCNDFLSFFLNSIFGSISYELLYALYNSSKSFCNYMFNCRMDNSTFPMTQLMTYIHESQQSLTVDSFLRSTLLFQLCFLRSGSEDPVCGNKKRKVENDLL